MPLDIDSVSRQYFERIHRAALVLTGNSWDADDLAQETFLVLARRPGRFEGRSSIYTWLYGVLLNLERQLRRTNGLRRQKLKVLFDVDAQEPRVAPAADVPVEADEWKRSLWSEVACLPDGQRQALVLRYSEHLQYEEIAEVLECPLGTVKSRIHHGLLALRNRLQGVEEPHISLFCRPHGEDLNHAS